MSPHESGVSPQGAHKGRPYVYACWAYCAVRPPSMTSSLPVM